MKAKEFIPAEKPRNFVAKNAKMGGAGQHRDKKKAEKQGDIKHKAKQYDESIMERDRDPEDWDEGNTEPPNNFAVYINGKKWKIFKGRGTYADDYREKQHYQQLKAWADKKSAATGKKWTVHVTGEMATEDIDEGWKDKLAAAALAGSMALGAGGAHGRTLPGADPEINRLTGKPNVTQVQKADDVKKTSNEQPAGAGFNSEYLKKVADGKHPRPMLSAEEAQQELERRGER
jgi:hypothetical protein